MLSKSTSSRAHSVLRFYVIDDANPTSIVSAIRAARDMLKGYKDGTKQIILITDGEPHANAYGYDWGRYEGGWSMREAMEETSTMAPPRPRMCRPNERAQ